MRRSTARSALADAAVIVSEARIRRLRAISRAALRESRIVRTADLPAATRSDLLPSVSRTVRVVRELRTRPRSRPETVHAPGEAAGQVTRARVCTVTRPRPERLA